MPTLYLVATPIGNLEDITQRALRVLGEVGLIAAEDTRKTLQLLNHFNIKAPLTSYHDHNKIKKLPFLLQKLEGIDIALVSDAGTPGLNDPGYELICACIQRKIPVVPIPGPSAILTALIVSGMSTERFVYLGYLPRKAGARRRMLESLASETRTAVVFEVPHRLREALEDMRAILPERGLALCRELTKIHEEVFRGTAEQALEHFPNPRGEFVIVIEGAKENIEDTRGAEARLKALMREGKSARDSVAEVAEAFGMPRREAYRMWQQLKG